jgi:hypothetical protein
VSNKSQSPRLNADLTFLKKQIRLKPVLAIGWEIFFEEKKLIYEAQFDFWPFLFLPGPGIYFL